MTELTSKQRKVLEKFAQPMSALVQIGGAGLTEAQVAQIDRCLADHELIKVKFNEFKDDKKDLTGEVVQIRMLRWYGLSAMWLFSIVLLKRLMTGNTKRH